MDPDNLIQERGMDWITEPERKTPIVADVDVLICGGGFAGVAAALSIKQRVAPRQLMVNLLQKTLMEQGVNLFE